MIRNPVFAATTLTAILLGSAVSSARSVGSLAVGDIAEGRVVIFDSALRHIRTITKGISPDPGGVRYDRAGNLYVVDVRNDVVQEYDPGGKRPAFTYTNVTGAGLVAVDSGGDVYVTNYDGRRKAWITVFPQHSNTLERRYTMLGRGGAGGIAFDQHGNLFVSYFKNKIGSHGSSGIEEFEAGSSRGRDLGIVLRFAGGLRVDANDNIVVCDGNAQSVKVFPEGSTEPSRTYRGFVVPGDVSLDRNNTTLFVSDEGAGTVAVLSYPSGTLERTLGHRDGIMQPGFIAAFPNDF